MKHLSIARNSFILTAIALVALVAAGCGKSDKSGKYGPDGKELEHPGVILIETGELPPGTLVDLLDETDTKLGEIPVGTPVDVEEGSYTLMLVTPKTGLSIAGTEVSIEAVDTRSESDVPVFENPTWSIIPEAPEFSAGTAIITVAEGKTSSVTLNLTPMTRRLIIRLTLNGFHASPLHEINANLARVVPTIDVREGFGAVDETSNGYTRTKSANAGAREQFLEFNILGFSLHEDHWLALRLTDIAGKSGDIAHNITDDVLTFNDGPAEEPLFFDAVVTLVNGEISGTIEPWTPGPDEVIPGV